MWQRAHASSHCCFMHVHVPKGFSKNSIEKLLPCLQNFLKYVRLQEDIQTKASAKTKQRCSRNTFNCKINAGWSVSTTKSLIGCMMIAISFMNRVLTDGVTRLYILRHPNDLFLFFLWQTSQSRVSHFVIVRFTMFFVAGTFSLHQYQAFTFLTLERAKHIVHYLL